MMPISNDCVRVKPNDFGRNLTPEPIAQSAINTLDGIELDVASDEIANLTIQAERIHTVLDDGFALPWNARSVFLNAPGTTLTGGTYEERVEWLQVLKDWQKEKKGPRPRHDYIRTIKAAHWYQKLYQSFKNGSIEEAIAIVYRAGSIGSVGLDFLSEASICLTSAGASSPIINGSGRLAFEKVDDNGVRTPQTSNTQSSVILLLSHRPKTHVKFRDEHSQFGAIFHA